MVGTLYTTILADHRADGLTAYTEQQPLGTAMAAIGVRSANVQCLMAVGDGADGRGKRKHVGDFHTRAAWYSTAVSASRDRFRRSCPDPRAYRPGWHFLCRCRWPPLSIRRHRTPVAQPCAHLPRIGARQTGRIEQVSGDLEKDCHRLSGYSGL